jgi:oleate hydratase
LENPDISVREECREFNEKVKTHANARLIDAEHVIADAAKLGLNTLHRAQMLRLLASKEEKIGSRRIDEFFDEAFLKPISGACGARLSLFKNGTVQQS